VIQRALYHFRDAETLTLIENVVTHIFQFMSPSLYSAEFTIGSQQRLFTRGRFCLQAYVSSKIGDCAKLSRSHLTAAVRASYEHSKICA